MTSFVRVNQTACTNFPFLNLTKPDTATSWIYSDREIYLATFVLPTLLLIGVVGNATFIYAVARIERLHSITNIYLVNLAIADILFLSIAIPIYIWMIFTSPVRNGVPWKTHYGCLSKPVVGSFYFTSICLVSLVTLERYYAICHPFYHREINTKKRTIKLIASTWLFGFVFCVCLGFADGQMVRYCVTWPDEDLFRNYPTEIKLCVTTKVGLVLLEELTKTIPFLIALAGNSFMYISIMRTLGSRGLEPEDKMEHSKPSEFQVQAAKVRKQVARLLIVNGLLFFISQIGVRILSFHTILKVTLGAGFLTSEGVGAVLIISRLMLFMNSVVNPIVYNLTSSIYREAFKEAFCRRGRGRTNDGESENTYSMSVTRNGNYHS